VGIQALLVQVGVLLAASVSLSVILCEPGFCSNQLYLPVKLVMPSKMDQSWKVRPHKRLSGHFEE